MIELEISKVKEYIEACPKEINLMLIGDTGIGKTRVIEDYCKENNLYLKTLILSQLEASESLGIPVMSEFEKDGKKYPCLKTAIPMWVFELAEQPNAVLFLDEFLCSEPATMNSFLNFLSQKRVGDIDLSHVRIISATNIGKYTFEPDNNILSRFCMFYVVNNSYNKFIKSNIINHYEDENDRDGSIFEERSLKPRCQEQLSFLENSELFNDFYQGFTNKPYLVFHKVKEYNDLLFPFVVIDEQEKCYITEDSLKTLSGIFKQKYPRAKRWDKFVSQISTNVTLNRDLFLKLLNK